MRAFIHSKNRYRTTSIAVLPVFLVGCVCLMWFGDRVAGQDRQPDHYAADPASNSQDARLSVGTRLESPVAIFNPATGLTQQVAKLRYTLDGDSGKRYIRRAISHGRDVHELISRTNKATPKELNAIQAELTQLLDAEFDEMQNQQSEKIASLAKQLEQLKERHQTRTDNKDKIVERRVIELMGQNDPYAWGPEPNAAIYRQAQPMWGNQSPSRNHIPYGEPARVQSQDLRQQYKQFSGQYPASAGRPPATLPSAPAQRQGRSRGRDNADRRPTESESQEQNGYERKLEDRKPTVSDDEAEETPRR